MEYSKEDLMEAKKQILGVGENMGTEESKKIWEENAQFWDNAMGDESNEFHREVVRPKVPEDFIVRVLGTGNPFGVILATIVGVPMYADIFGTIPIAEALLAKGAQLGVVLSFMMGVTTLSLPSMIMLRKAVKPKLLGIFIAICTVGIILVGYFFNAIQYLLV